MTSVLDSFHPLISAWFREEVGAPTEVQRAVWPLIQSGRHVLATAPTGSGKTLAAFLWAIDRLGTGAWPGGGVQVLYVSPLKALNNDIQRNLIGPVEAIGQRFEGAGESMGAIRVQTRSGDTDPTERQRMVRRPPHILITTPESLNLMLASPRAQGMFTPLRLVILDEIHAVAGTKRGTHLMLAVERLTRLAGEFQRVALSATVTPLERVAAFVGGYQAAANGGYAPRDVAIAAAARSKRLAIRVHYPRHAPAHEPGTTTWSVIAEAVRERIAANRATLVFTNSRRTCERMSLLLNEGAERPVYAHHGSLSREVRSVVEQRLKKGSLAAIVATSSLELGIDIGELDEVALVQTPPTVASALQRIGRAGHRVDAESRGLLLPTHGHDLLKAAVMTRAALEQDIEPVAPPEAPLDVLAQVIVAMAAIEPWPVDALYGFIRTCAPYQQLSRGHFDLVVDMLAGRYAETRIRELQPLVAYDRVDGVIGGTRGALMRLYGGGGTIADRGYYTMRREDTHARIAELDEEFVWERRVGDSFTLGTQSWRVARITHNDVLVTPAAPRWRDVPFWRADERHRSAHFSDRLLAFLEEVEARWGDSGLAARLAGEQGLAPEAAEALAAYLGRQRQATRTPLPHRRHVVIESIAGEPGTEEGRQVVIHTLWGGQLNVPFGLALAQALEEARGERVDVFANDDCVAALLTDTDAPEALLERVRPANLDSLLRKRLEQSGWFGAKFRESAGIALQLPRHAGRRRVPLWLSRQKAKRLMAAVAPYADFPILLEAWRVCLQDTFAIDALSERLDELRAGRIAVSVTQTAAPSPFAADMSWRQTNTYMYADDSAPGGRPTALRRDLIEEVARSRSLRPRIPAGVVASFERKAQRLAPGYAPLPGQDLVEWVKERLFVPRDEWASLVAAVEAEAGEPMDRAADWARKLARVSTPHGAEGVCAAEERPRLDALAAVSGTALEWRAVDASAPEPAWGKQQSPKPDTAGWLGQWLRYYGPVRVDGLARRLPLAAQSIDDALQSLADEELAVVDTLTADAGGVEVCDAQNLEVLLRLARARARPAFSPLPLERLPVFAALHQGLTTTPGEPEARLETALEQLAGWPMAAAALEADILPARVPGYRPRLLDAFAAEQAISWYGCGKERISLGFADDALALKPPSRKAHAEAAALFPDTRGRYPFHVLQQYTGLGRGELTERLWKGVWAGAVGNDSWAALRQGIGRRFVSPHPAVRASGRLGSLRRREMRPWPGNWYLLPVDDGDADPVEADERAREAARLLLLRHGVVFRERLGHEQGPLQWAAVFRALRLMELAGEVVAGQFVEGIPGPQFAAPQTLELLEAARSSVACYWWSAVDPASPCGLGIDWPPSQPLPRRVATSHMAWVGAQPVLASDRGGRRLRVHARLEGDAADAADALLRHLVERARGEQGYVAIDQIDGRPAGRSAWAGWLRERFETTADTRGLSLWP